jgi:putative hemolysin
MTIVWLVIALVGCLAVQAFFAASEIALVSADDLKVRAGSEGGHERSQVLGELLANRDRLLALTLTGTNLATVIAAVVLTSFLYEIGPRLVYLAPFILTPITLVVGESIPKLLTLTNPHAFALFAARPLRFLATLLAPLLSAETVLSRLLRSLAGVPADAESVFLSRDDLARLMRRRPSDASGQQPQDAILPAEQLMISRIFRFSQADARKAMVRRWCRWWESMRSRKTLRLRRRSKLCAAKDSAAFRCSGVESRTSSASFMSSIFCRRPISAVR